jgi:hypothetical protein
MAKLEELFSMKLTENGDVAFDKVSFNNPNLNTLFGTEYYQNHLNEVTIGDTPKDRLFSMFIRDPRFGLGKRDLGRRLMKLSNVSLENVVKAGRFDDVFAVFGLSREVLDYAKKEKWLATQMAWFQRWLKDDPSWWEVLYPKKNL